MGEIKQFSDIEVKVTENDEYRICMYEDEKYIRYSEKGLEIVMNDLLQENKELKQELNKYHRRFDCHQCHYHDYDGLGIDFEYEICDKGNDEALMYNHSCSEWEEL